MAYQPPGVQGVQGQLLEINVVGCRNLNDKEWFTRQDPYVTIEYASNRFRTRTDTDGGKNPSFNEKFVIPLIEGLREINATVWNSNSLTYDDLIGSTRVLIEKAVATGYCDAAWPLKSRSGKYAGELRLIMHYGSATQSKAQGGYQAPMGSYPVQKQPPSPVPSYGPAYPPQQYSPGSLGYPPQPGYPPASYAAGGSNQGGYPSAPPQPGYPPASYAAGGSSQGGVPPAGYPPAGYPPAVSYKPVTPYSGYPANPAVPAYPAAPGYPPATSHIPYAQPSGYSALTGGLTGGALGAGVAALASGLLSHGNHGRQNHGNYNHGHYNHGSFGGRHSHGKHKHKGHKHKWK